MKKLLMALLTVVLSLGLAVGDAEAKRLGSGKSTGMQRESVAQRPASAPAATPSAAPATAPAAAPKRNWMGPLAGLAAGLGIAALMSHFGLGEGLGNILMIALLAMAAIFVVRLLLGRKTAPPQHAEPMQYAGVGGPAMAPPPQAPSPFGASAAAPAAVGAADLPRRIPEGFDADGFLRVAKLNFIRLQASNDARNLDDIREFVSPELYAEIKMQMDERGSAPQQTDVVTLEGELLEVVSEGHRHVASVRFHGMIREEAGAPAAAFDEVWNLTKPLDGSKGWTVAGIQQLG